MTFTTKELKEIRFACRATLKLINHVIRFNDASEYEPTKQALQEILLKIEREIL